MGASGGVSNQKQQPGTLSPATAVLFDLFGGAPKISGGQYVPSSFGGGEFGTSSFAALPGLLSNIPMTGTEAALTSPGFQALAGSDVLRSRDALGLGVEALPALLDTSPDAAIAAARRGFTEETLPAILERAPGFSSSDLQRELVRGGTDLETNIAALREANLGRVGQTLAGLPAFAQAVGTGLLDNASQVLGFGQLGREFVREVSPAGDAFRVLTALQGLTGPALTTRGTGSSKTMGGGISGG